MGRCNRTRALDGVSHLFVNVRPNPDKSSIPTPRAALRRGHFLVTGPVLGLMVVGALLAGGRWGVTAMALGILLAMPVAWLWWAYQIPRWRDWVVERGVSQADVESQAVKSGLLWPRGSFFERTEFRRRNGERGW